MAAYDEKSIQLLEGLDAVRKRPGMYIGGTGPEGLHHLVWELIDNAVDEAAAGHANLVEVTLHKDGSVEVADNGRGIPTGKKDGKRTALEIVFTELHAGGKFGGGAYSASGGLHGVGASVVNALSSKLVAEVDRDGTTQRLTFVHRAPGRIDAKGHFKAGSALETVRKSRWCPSSGSKPAPITWRKPSIDDTSTSSHVGRTVGPMIAAAALTSRSSCSSAVAGLAGLSGTAIRPEPMIARYETTKYQLLPAAIATRSPGCRSRPARPPRSRPTCSRSSP